MDMPRFMCRHTFEKKFQKELCELEMKFILTSKLYRELKRS